jgi:phosphoglycolate phosphatase-like HAD superfamily hydrolase
MTNAGAYGQKKALIANLQDSETRVPDMPMRYFVQRATVQVELAQLNKKDLEPKLDYTLVDEAPSLICALRHILSAWTDVQFDTPATKKLWIEKQAEGESARFELCSALETAFPYDPDVTGLLKKIREGGSNPDEIQDLCDLVYASEKRVAILEKESDLTAEKLKEFAELAAELGQIYAKAVVDRTKEPEVLLERNKTFTLVDNIMTEIWRRADYRYRDNERKRKQFTFTYEPPAKKKTAVKEAVPA